MLGWWVGHWVIGSWQLNESYLNFQNSLPFFVTSKRNIYMFSFMFCCEFSNIGNIQHTLYQRYKHPSLSFSIFSSKLLILHEFKLFLILYAKCKCNITTSKEDKPPYQHNTRHTMHRRTIITPPSPLSPSDDEWMPTCWGPPSPHANITNPYFFLRAAFPWI